jgi:glycosyltransferase involved in cell wall biosynthesis
MAATDRLASIIIRTKNEERWVTSCLRSVFNQDYENMEVVIVDNKSTDMTLKKAREFPVKIVEIEQFLPGRAINHGIRNSSGELIVCLSGHCIPTSPKWLGKLIADLEHEEIAGVYGRQDPLSFSSPLDKRDLLNLFGLDKKLQIRDGFFHNANSALRRATWDEYPFDEEVTNIEDRVWATKVLADGFKIAYEPEASVYHHHGVHQDMDRDRAARVVRIMEGIDGLMEKAPGYRKDQMHVLAIIPARGKPKFSGGKSLLEYSVRNALNAETINEVIVATDEEETAAIAKQLGAAVPFIRPRSLSEDYVDIAEVLRYTLEKVESDGIVPDLIVIMEETYPFRPPDLLDTLVGRVIDEGLDSVVAVKEEPRHIWLHSQGKTSEFGEGFMPRQFKDESAYIGLLGLGCVTHPSFLRNGDLLGHRVGVFEIDDPFCAIEIRNEKLFEIATQMLDKHGGG